MPIYEYYCSTCDARFSHLARRFDEPRPPCPGCGSCQVEKLIPRVHTGRSEAERRAAFEARSGEVNQADCREIARFLQDAGSLAEGLAPLEGDVFREIVARRAEGAKDEAAGLQDVTDALSFPSREEMVHLHEQAHHDDDEHHEHGEAHGHKCLKKGSPRRSRDLGWA